MKPGHLNGEFMRPYGIALAAGGSAYVTDTGNGRVEVFGAHGTIDPSGVTEWIEGDAAAYNVAADAHYHVAALDVDGIPATLTAGTYTITGVDARHTISARFAVDTLALRYKAGTGGSIDGSATQVVGYGASGTTVTAVPEAGYHFVKWSDESTSNPRIDTSVTADATHTALFATPRDIHVSKSGSDTDGDGSPEDPYVTVQHAIDVAYSGDTVRVGEGAYWESITMKDGVSLLGAGEKTGLLCVGAPAVSAGSGVGADTVISGFTIANGDKGIYCRDGASPTIVNNHFEGNTYGVLCEDGASPTIASNSFEGGLYGIVCADSSPAIINSTISKNKSGIQCYSSSPTIANVTIYGLFEYGIWTDGASSPTITNCIVRESGYADLVNCAATYSNIGTAGQDVGVGNINADPLFVDDFRLRAGSPCIDTGTPDGAPATDKDGVARPFGGGYDMGAYESRWCTFRYVALAGGSIEGNATQVVAHGGSGTTVTAKPAAGHHFVGWSDGVLTAARADTGVTADATYTAAFARVLAAASITRTPDRSSVTLTRKRGTARFTLSAVIKGWGGEAIAGHRVYLQSSRTGERWSNTYGITTTATGKASKAFRIATKRVRYYRWYVPARSEVCLMTYSGVTKVTVR